MYVCIIIYIYIRMHTCPELMSICRWVENINLMGLTRDFSKPIMLQKVEEFTSPENYGMHLGLGTQSHRG